MMPEATFRFEKINYPPKNKSICERKLIAIRGLQRPKTNPTTMTILLIRVLKWGIIKEVTMIAVIYAWITLGKFSFTSMEMKIF